MISSCENFQNSTIHYSRLTVRKQTSKIDLEKLELLEGSLFYMPYYIVWFSRRGESRFLVWDREGKENDAIADEFMKNSKFRDLIQSHGMSSEDSGMNSETRI